jgi:hypothetical protein
MHGEWNIVHVSEILIRHVFYTDITKADVYCILFRARFKHANAIFSFRCLCVPKNTLIVPITLLIIYSHTLSILFRLVIADVCGFSCPYIYTWMKSSRHNLWRKRRACSIQNIFRRNLFRSYKLYHTRLEYVLNTSTNFIEKFFCNKMSGFR